MGSNWANRCFIRLINFKRSCNFLIYSSIFGVSTHWFSVSQRLSHFLWLWPVDVKDVCVNPRAPSHSWCRSSRSDDMSVMCVIASYFNFSNTDAPRGILSFLAVFSHQQKTMKLTRAWQPPSHTRAHASSLSSKRKSWACVSKYHLKN